MKIRKIKCLYIEKEITELFAIFNIAIENVARVNSYAERESYNLHQSIV